MHPSCYSTMPWIYKQQAVKTEKELANLVLMRACFLVHRQLLLGLAPICEGSSLMSKSHLKATLRGTTALVGRMSAYDFGETDSVSNRGKKHMLDMEMGKEEGH